MNQNRQSGGQCSSQRQGDRKQCPTLNGFFTKDGLVNSSWISEKIQEFAEFLSADRKFTTTQLRNFYHEYLRIQNMPAKKEEKIIMVKMIKAKINYKSDNVPYDFIKFTNNLIDEIQTNELFDKYFDNACLIMEALVAYYPKR
ncbi:MAG TPA: type III-A CRISPR-associated protein Csm2 [Candidatus Cloacimonadota bacterium]|nr:type III-A CRISPR-associated protein Csm2 [Candidatus Cloacimonadota bacterium]HPK41368.1 type III-A CRISPR-associated protein Csm2 [Candidatus Cloacimonadota bacterium]